MTEIEFKPDTKITQQKEWRVPLQLLESADSEVESSIHEQRLENLRTVNDKLFMQPGVNTVKGKSVKVALYANKLITATV